MQVSLTVRQAVDASNALQALARADMPLAFAVKVARLRFAVLAVVEPVEEARRLTVERRAPLEEDGSRRVRRLDSGAVIYDLTAAEEFAAEQEFDAVRRESRVIDIEPLTLADFPTKVRGDELSIAADIFVGLGPLFREHA